MTNKDIFKILLCLFGYDRNIKIDTFRTAYGTIGYEIEAENKDGDVFSECNGENVVYNVYAILDYMQKNAVEFESRWWEPPLKYLLTDSERERIVDQWDIVEKQHQKIIKRLLPVWEWRDNNNPCPNCDINKKDHWDSIHYNCELCHTHSCDILKVFQAKYANMIKEKTANNLDQQKR